MKSIHHKYLEIIKEMQEKHKDIKFIQVNAFKYENDTVTPNRICIIDEESLPSCIDVFTNKVGKDCARRYVPEKKSGHWCFNDGGEYFCSKCWNYPKGSHPKTKYCPNCGSPMDNFVTN